MTQDDTSGKAFAAWLATNAKRAEAASKLPPIDWKNVKLDPKSIGVEMGPVLTEEQFKAYCQQTGTRHPVMKLDPKKKC